MAWFIQSIIGFFIYIAEFIVKKIGIQKTLLLFIIPLWIAYLGFMLTAIIYILDYLINLWLAVKNLMNTMFDYSSVSGSFGGISNSTVVSSMFALIHQSGLADALMIAGDLFIGLLSVYFTIQAYKLIVWAKDNTISIVATLGNLLIR